MRHIYGIFGTRNGGNRYKYTSNLRTAIRAVADIENAQLYRMPAKQFYGATWDNPTFRATAERFTPTQQQYRAAGIRGLTVVQIPAGWAFAND